MVKFFQFILQQNISNTFEETAYRKYQLMQKGILDEYTAERLYKVAPEAVDPAIVSCGPSTIRRYTKAALELIGKSEFCKAPPLCRSDPRVKNLPFWKNPPDAICDSVPSPPQRLNLTDFPMRPLFRNNYADDDGPFEEILEELNTKLFHTDRYGVGPKSPEPEWFSNGPKSKKDVIQLRGFVESDFTADMSSGIVNINRSDHTDSVNESKNEDIDANDFIGENASIKSNPIEGSTGKSTPSEGMVRWPNGTLPDLENSGRQADGVKPSEQARSSRDQNSRESFVNTEPVPPHQKMMRNAEELESHIRNPVFLMFPPQPNQLQQQQYINRFSMPRMSLPHEMQQPPRFFHPHGQITELPAQPEMQRPQIPLPPDIFAHRLFQHQQMLNHQQMLISQNLHFIDQQKAAYLNQQAFIEQQQRMLAGLINLTGPQATVSPMDLHQYTNAIFQNAVIKRRLEDEQERRHIIQEFQQKSEQTAAENASAPLMQYLVTPNPVIQNTPTEADRLRAACQQNMLGANNMQHASTAYPITSAPQMPFGFSAPVGRPIFKASHMIDPNEHRQQTATNFGYAQPPCASYSTGIPMQQELNQRFYQSQTNYENREYTMKPHNDQVGHQNAHAESRAAR